jgi:hypothetical protein
MRPVALMAVLFLAGCQASTDSKSGSGSATSKSAANTAAARPAPAPTPVPVVIPEGTILPVVLETDLSSDQSKEGDAIVAHLSEDVKVGERVVLKQGAELRGMVTSAMASGRVKGRAHLAFDFDKLIANGKERPVALREVDITADSNKKHDAAVIGGGAGAGAIIGAIADGKKGAAIGGLIGGATGTGVVLATRGKEVRLPSGTAYRLRLEKDVRL